jgi:hypothetical protein
MAGLFICPSSIRLGTKKPKRERKSLHADRVFKLDPRHQALFSLGAGKNPRTSSIKT